MTDSRAALLRALGTVLAEEGLAGLSLRKVAARAGLSHAAPGVVFGDRAGMYTAFAIEGFHRFHQAMAAVPCGRDGPADVAAVGRAYIAFALAEPELFEVMFRQDLLNARDPAYVAAAREAYGPFLAAVQRCIREGHVAEADAAEVQLAAWSLVHGFATLWRSKHTAGRVRGGADAAAHAITERFAASIRRTNAA